MTAGASWYFAWLRLPIPLLGFIMTPEFLRLRGFVHFSVFLLTFYLGFLRKGTGDQQPTATQKVLLRRPGSK